MFLFVLDDDLISMFKYEKVPSTGWIIGAIYDQAVSAQASNDIIFSLFLTG